MYAGQHGRPMFHSTHPVAPSRTSPLVLCSATAMDLTDRHVENVVRGRGVPEGTWPNRIQPPATWPEESFLRRGLIT